MTWLVLAVAPAPAQQKKKSAHTTTKKASTNTAKQSTPDTVTYTNVKDLATLKDGAYEGNGWYSEYLYRSYSFVKRGSSVSGFTANSGGVWCFQGTFAGNVITIADAVNWDEEYDDLGRRTGHFTFSPLWNSLKNDFASVRMTSELRTFRCDAEAR